MVEPQKERYTCMECLGSGSFGTVWKALDTVTNEIVALKNITLDADSDPSEVYREIEILKKCDSPYIVKYKGSSAATGELRIAMEYCGAGSVLDLIQVCKITLSEDEVRDVAAAMLLGLAYLHANRNIHRDIKAGNVLLSIEGAAKLADFGVSAQLTRTISRAATVIGTPLWMAPEVIQDDSYYNGKADIWSLGVTTIEMADGYPPHADMHPMRAIFQIPLLPSPTVQEPAKWSKEFNDFVAQCVNKDPDARPTAQELLAHPFVAPSVAMLNKSGGTSKLLSDLVARNLDTMTSHRTTAYATAGRPQTLPPASFESKASDDPVAQTNQSEESGLYDTGSVMLGDHSVRIGGDTGTTVFNDTMDPSSTVVFSGTVGPTSTVVMNDSGGGSEYSFMKDFEDEGKAAPPRRRNDFMSDFGASSDDSPEELMTQLQMLDASYGAKLQAMKQQYTARRDALLSRVAAVGGEWGAAPIM